jgi:uncharacterized protein
MLVLAGCASAELTAVPSTACDFAFRSSEARYQNGDVDLAGEWIRPVSEERAPAIVILQGSGSSDRSNAWAALIAHTLARCGVAVLLTDKRGSGASGGDWRNSSLLDLAADGAAGLQWVSSQPGVDRDRIGFLGLSQGGQVAPAAAALANEADFVVSWVTSVGPLKDALLYELLQTYRQHDLTEAQIGPLQEMARASFVWLETGEGWDDYLAARERANDMGLSRATESWPVDQQDGYWLFWRLNGSFDALPYWRRLADRGIPGLVVLGEEDARDNVDVASTVRLLNEAVGARVVTAVIPGVGHSLQVSADEIHPRAIAMTLEVVRAPGGR